MSAFMTLVAAWLVALFGKACYHTLPNGLPLTAFTGWFRVPIASSLRSFLSGKERSDIIIDAISLLGCLAVIYTRQWHMMPAIILLAYCIACSAVDLKHRVIPHQLTLPFMVLGLLLSAMIPEMQRKSAWPDSVFASFLGLIAGGFAIAAIAELGKIAFGRHICELSPPETFHFKFDDKGNHSIVADGAPLPWEELFNRPTDKMILYCSEVRILLREFGAAKLTISSKSVQINDGDKTPIDSEMSFSGVANKIVRPREAMGYGDAQFMVVVGAFLGWEAAISVIFAGAIVGSVIGVTQKLCGKGNVMPFIPALALGVAAWGLWGGLLLKFYFHP